MATNDVINNQFADNFTAPNKVSKNLMPAGNFSTNPWQRGTSFAVTTSNIYFADRFRFLPIGVISATFTITKDSDSPTIAQSGVFSTHCAKYACNTAQAVIAAGDIIYYYYGLEGFDFSTIAQRPFTLSFWVKSNLTGTYCVNFRNGGVDRSYVAEYTINAANTWEYKTITVSASPSAGTWNYTANAGLFVGFVLSCGSTFQTTANAWQTGNFYATSNQVNFANSNTNTIQFALMQLEAGTVATPYEIQTEQEVLSYCQRYFIKTFNQGVVPAQASGSLLGALQYRVRRGGIVTTDGVFYRLATRMRTTPSYTAYNPINTGTTWYNVTNAANSGVSSLANGGGTGASYRCSQLVTDVAGNLLAIHATAQAEV